MREILKQNIHKVNVPLMSVYDFMGFRLIALSLVRLLLYPFQFRSSLLLIDVNRIHLVLHIHAENSSFH